MRLHTTHVDDLETGAASAVGAAVVIDVVRAFTVAPWCLARGAERLLLAPSVAGALAACDRYPGALLLKDGQPDPRFALPNAPGRIAREDLGGRVVVQRTGNGTRGAHAVAAAPLVLVSSFATAGATARTLLERGVDDVLLVPTEGDEDWALADYLRTLIDGRAAVDPTPFLHRVRASTAAQECRDRGSDPAFPGFDPDDLDRCLELDRFDRAVLVEPDGDLLAARWYPTPAATP